MKSIFEMTPEERKEVMDANPPEISGVRFAHTYFDWGWKGCGFGQLEVILTTDGELIVENECIDRERVRKILHAWADFIADRAVLSDNPDDIPPVDFKAERAAEQAAEEEYMKKHGLI